MNKITNQERLRLYLIRHGEVEQAADGRLLGRTDTPLSERGLEQSRQLSENLSVARISAVYSSDLQRARVFAETIANRHGLEALSTYEFASDENPNKNRAREMMRMLGDINVHLKKIEPSGDQRVNMWCHTCHRGRPRPMSLEEELGEQYRLKGVDTALSHYQDLKKNYAEQGAYDFSEQSLNNFGYEVLEKKDTAAAIRVFMLNAQGFPKSANVWDSLADAYMRAGDMKAAKRYYEKSLKLDPKNDGARENLKKIKATAGK